MKRLLDTSVLVAAMVAAHPAHARSVRFLERALAGRCESCVSTHSLAEIYAVLTRMPTSPRISPDVARRLVHDNLETGGAPGRIGRDRLFGGAGPDGTVRLRRRRDL